MDNASFTPDAETGGSSRGGGSSVDAVPLEKIGHDANRYNAKTNEGEKQGNGVKEFGSGVTESGSGVKEWGRGVKVNPVDDDVDRRIRKVGQVNFAVEQENSLGGAMDDAAPDKSGAKDRPKRDARTRKRSKSVAVMAAAATAVAAAIAANRKVSVLPDLPDGLDSKPWRVKSTKDKVKSVLKGIATFMGFIACLYFFICSLDLLSSGFKLLGGEATGSLFKESALLSNPICGLMIGVVATVAVQSSSTSTSIVVAMTASRLLPVENAIPIIMGANVGTSVTNTLVSLAQVGDRIQFERAFAGATVHDMFNWLSVFILLPLELATGYLFLISESMTKGMATNGTGGAKIELLTVLTDPLTDLVVQVDSDAIQKAATKNSSLTGNFTKERVMKVWCTTDSAEDVRCGHIFANWPWLSDAQVGVILLVSSLFVLIISLILLVSLLQRVFKGSVGRLLQSFLNAEFPGILEPLTGYAAMLVGAGVTVLVQSSSIFTSTLTPLVGIGAVTLERFYPLTLGSNIGTTFTAVMAAMAASGDDARVALQIALCHLFFNLSGICLFYPVPFMRKLPIGLAERLGHVTARYRWFCAVYVVAMFVVVPSFVLALSLAGPIPFGVVLGLLLLFFLSVFLVNFLQRKRPRWLPPLLRDWTFLPLWLRSLRPYDAAVVACATRCCGCCGCVKNLRRDEEEEWRRGGEKKGVENPTAVEGE